ncbi:hypothetical protein ACFLU6_05700 [Acidobacteriota bacterium]
MARISTATILFLLLVAAPVLGQAAFDRTEHKPARSNGTDKHAPTVLHEPVTFGVPDQPIVIRARILDKSGVKLASVLYRDAKRSSDYQVLRMEKTKDSTYRAVIPIENDHYGNIEYFIKAVDAHGNSGECKGSAAAPIVIHLEDFNAPPGSFHFPVFAFVAVLTLLCLFFVMWALKRRKKRHEELNRRFWKDSLVPLLSLAPDVVTQRVTELSSKTLHHPVDGEKKYTRLFILHKLKQLRKDHGISQVFGPQTYKKRHQQGPLESAWMGKPEGQQAGPTQQATQGQ